MEGKLELSVSINEEVVFSEELNIENADKDVVSAAMLAGVLKTLEKAKEDLIAKFESMG